MKTSIKLLALLMSLLMLVTVFAACGDNGDGEGTTAGDGGTTTVGGGEGTTTDDGNGGGEQSVDLGGYIYKSLIREKISSADGNSSFPVIDFWVETASADVLSKAVYDRNINIQDTYNCVIQKVSSNESSTMYESMEQYYMGGEKYELSVLSDKSAATCATANLLADLNSMKNIDLKNAAFDQNANQQLGMGGKLYYTSGDMNVSCIDSAAVTIFNEEMYATLEGQPNLYNLVDKGEWTLATEMAIAKVASKNESGGATLDYDKGDTVGYFRYLSSTMYHFFAGGGRISTNDEDGYPMISIDSDHAEDVIQNMFDLMSNGTNPLIPSGNGGKRNTGFANGHVLFTDLLLWDVRTQIHGKEVSYGMLPMPKYDTDQTEFFHNVYFGNGTVSLWAMPSFTADKDKASFMFNLMAVESSKPDSTMDAFYAKTVELTTATGEDSRRMCQIIRKSLCYDIAQLYDWGSFMTFVNGIGGAAANTYSSTVNPQSVDAAISDMNKTLEKFKNPTLPQA